MVNTSDFSNLPSLEFDKKFRTDIQYEKLISFEEKKTSEADLNIWIEKFKKELEKYFNIEYKSLNEELRQKRCRDLDYWVFKVEGKMSDLSKNLNLFNTIFLFQKDVPLIFNKIKDPECVRNKDTLNNLE
ncbi:PIR Superfamily Protein, partial [Plasmodium ovale curtisi]